MEVGEELRYESIFRIYQTRLYKFQNLQIPERRKKDFITQDLKLKTYPEVPFLKINEIFESEMESGKKFIHGNFLKRILKTNQLQGRDYKFNYQKIR